MIWSVEVLKIQQEEQIQINFYKIKVLNMQEILNLMDIKDFLPP